MELAKPAAPSSGIQWKDLKGSLLLFTVKGLETNIQTSFGVTDAVRADVVDLDDDETYPDALVFPKVLISQLRPQSGKQVVGRLGQGQAKPGQSPPWVLEDPTDDDVETAKSYLTSTPSNNGGGDNEMPF